MVVSQIGSSWRHHARTTLLSDGESGIIPGERTSSGFHANQVIARIGGKHRSVLSPLREWNSNSFPAASELAVVHESDRARTRSEEHTSELQSLMRISYAVFCLKKKKT